MMGSRMLQNHVVYLQMELPIVGMADVRALFSSGVMN